MNKEQRRAEKSRKVVINVKGKNDFKEFDIIKRKIDVAESEVRDVLSNHTECVQTPEQVQALVVILGASNALCEVVKLYFTERGIDLLHTVAGESDHLELQDVF